MSFIFGGKTGETAAGIARKRAIAQAMQKRSLSRTPRNIGEGISAVGNALAGRIISGRADAREAEGREGARKVFDALNSGGGVEEARALLANDFANEGMRQFANDKIASMKPVREKVGDDFVEIGPDGTVKVLHQGFDKDRELLGALGPDGLPQAAQVEYGVAPDANTTLQEDGRNNRHVTASGGDILTETGRMARHNTVSAGDALSNKTALYKHANASGGERLQASVSTSNNASNNATSRENNMRTVAASIGNNQRTNQTSAANNQRSVGATIRGQDVGANTAYSKLVQDAAQFAAGPDVQRNYEKYRNQQAAGGVMPDDMMDFAEYQKSLKGGGVTVNNGPQGVDFGKPEAGLAWKRNADGSVAVDDRGAPVALPYQGGSVYQDQQATEDAATKSQDLKARQGSVVIEDADRMIKLIEDSDYGLFNTTTGALGSLIKNIGGTASADVAALAETVRGNAGFDKLQAMREASPTGGALGQVSNVELRQLNAAIGNLEQSQSQEQILYNIERVKQIYTEIVHGPQDTSALGASGDLSSMSDDDLMRALNGG